MYSGWIPTVSGRLSFSIIGHANHPTPAITSNVTNGKTRYILSYQRRFLLDPLISTFSKVIPILLRREGVFWCVCVAQCPDSSGQYVSDLEGTLYIFHGKKNWRGAVEKNVKHLQNILDNQFRNTKGSNEEVIKRFELLTSFLKTTSSYYCKFTLRRNGVTRLFPPQVNEIRAGAPTGHDNENTRKAICSQLFYFLKDITHEHQHHNPNTDTLIGIYPTDDDLAWRVSTLRILYRRIIQFKRTKISKIFYLSLGLLTYVKSFCTISDDEGKKVPVEWNIDALTESIQIAKQKHEAEIDETRNSNGFVITFLLSIAGVVISISGLLSLAKIDLQLDETLVNKFLISITILALTQPLTVIAVMMLLAYILAIRFRYIDLLDYDFFKHILRVFVAFKKDVIIAILFAAGTFLLGIYVYVLLNLMY